MTAKKIHKTIFIQNLPDITSHYPCHQHLIWHDFLKHVYQLSLGIILKSSIKLDI